MVCEKHVWSSREVQAATQRLGRPQARRPHQDPVGERPRGATPPRHARLRAAIRASSSRTPAPDSCASAAPRPVSNRRIAAIGPSTRWPSPADHGWSVAASRKPASFSRARNGHRSGQTRAAAAAAAWVGIGRVRPSGMATRRASMTSPPRRAGYSRGSAQRAPGSPIWPSQPGSPSRPLVSWSISLSGRATFAGCRIRTTPAPGWCGSPTEGRPRSRSPGWPRPRWRPSGPSTWAGQPRANSGRRLLACAKSQTPTSDPPGTRARRGAPGS